MSGQVVVNTVPCPLAESPSSRSCHGWSNRCSGCMSDGRRALLDTAIPVEGRTLVSEYEAADDILATVWVEVTL